LLLSITIIGVKLKSIALAMWVNNHRQQWLLQIVGNAGYSIKHGEIRAFPSDQIEVPVLVGINDNTLYMLQHVDTWIVSEQLFSRESNRLKDRKEPVNQ